MLLIFDCDGVVIDSMNLHTEVEAEAYCKLGIKVTPEYLVKRFSGVAQTEVSRILGLENGCLVPQDIEKQINKHREVLFAERLRAIPGIQKVLKDIQDIPRCIASGSRVEELQYALGLVGLYKDFAPHIFSSEMVARGKPFPDLFLYAAQKMGCLASDCIVIEDSVLGVQAGRTAGMVVFGFAGGSHCYEGYEDQLKQNGASEVFSDMHNLPSLISKIKAKHGHKVQLHGSPSHFCM